MRHRQLGHSTLQASAIGLGCMSMSGVYGPGDDAESVRVIQRALDLGMSFVDSSDMYGWGHNEELIGRAIQGHRAQVVLTTKFGQVRAPDGRGTGRRPAGVRPGGLRREPQAARRGRHRPLLPAPGGPEGADRGDRRRHGAPARDGQGAGPRPLEAAPDTIRRAHRTHPISAVQTEYSLLYRSPGEETLAVCRELGITFRRLLAARAQPPDRHHPRLGRPAGGRPAPPAPAVPGPEPRPQREAGPAPGGDGGGEGRPRRPAGPGLAARSRGRRAPHPGQQAARPPGGERRRARRPARSRRPPADRRGHARRRCRRHALPGAADEGRPL